MIIQPVILSGGSGTRLWPLSRELYPKQLLPLVGDNSLLQETLLRLPETSVDGNIQCSDPIVICNNEHRFLVAEQLREININPGKIILEPFGRNTAPALTLAALVAEGDALLLVLPADHAIADLDTFHRACATAAHLANDGYLVTFGITPLKPETGYGYIRVGNEISANDSTGNHFTAYLIDQFVEKPDQPTAETYLSSGNYLWNSGMFMMKASVWLAQIERHEPGILAACDEAEKNGMKDLDFFRIEEKAFAKSPSNSIDYAVMEKACGASTPGGNEKSETLAAVVSLDAGWSDVGAWSSLWEVGQQDSQGNVIKGDVKTHNVENSFVHAEHRFVAGIGLKDAVVVETADAVLVANKNNAQDVKQIVEWLKENNREERIVHRRVFRPWGSYEGVVAGPRFQVKRIVVNPGASLSLQKHQHRAEHWIVVSGTAQVTRNEEVFQLTANESTYIPIGAKHRLENPGKIPLEIIEVQSGDYLGEDDIVRFEDNYGR